MDIRPIWRGTPNYRELRNGHKPEAIVIHVTESWTMESARNWFLNPASDVSAHYLVGQDGSCDQFVDETDTAQTQGVVDRPTWKLIKKTASGKYVNPNWYCLSIEHEGMPGEVWPQVQKVRSSMLIAEMHVRWGIPLDRQHVIGHYEIRASKPGCPGNPAIVNELLLMAQGRLQ